MSVLYRDKVCMRTRLDLERLRQEIRSMTYDSSLYQVLKEELEKLGHWRNKKRGSTEGLKPYQEKFKRLYKGRDKDW
jgi:protein associated with RNAse G/E